MTALKSLIFLLVVPGLVGFYVPLTFFRTGPQVETALFAYLAFLLWPSGTLALLWCFWDFLAKGRGTPAPVEPPKELVASGLYRLVRNPMYVSVLMILLGHFLWLGHLRLLAYAGAVWLATHLFVALYEEPNLRKRFGGSYEEYLHRVPRWIPKFK
jgi:protein-S-isoprenylcysteine O-methyltransferase Ste14